MQAEEIRMSRKITVHLKVLVKNYGLFPDHINIHFLGLGALCVNYFNYQTQEKNILVKQCHYKSIILKLTVTFCKETRAHIPRHYGDCFFSPQSKNIIWP